MKSMTLKFDEMPDEQFTDPEVFIIECLCQKTGRLDIEMASICILNC